MDILLVGATGLVGSLCLKRLATQPDIATIVSVSRRPLPASFPRVIERLGRPEEFETLLSDRHADTAICCLGTTLRKAGSREAFEEIDLNLPLYFARAAQRAGVRNFHVITSVGADASSSHFYLRIKGLLENELKTLGFPSLHIYRPSLLIGERDDRRPAEKFAQLAYRRLSFLYPTVLNAYRPLEAARLADFMVKQIKAAQPGIHIWDNVTILKG